MLKVEEMTKLTMIGPKSKADEIIDRLYDLRLYHLVDHKKTDYLDIGRPLEASDTVSDILVKIRAMCSFLGIETKANRKGSKKKIQKVSELAAIKRNVDGINDSVLKISIGLKEIEEGRRKLEERKAFVESIKAIRLDMVSFQDFETLDYAFGSMENIRGLEKEVKAITGRSKVYTAYHDNMNIAAIFFEKRFKNEVMEKLSKRGFSEIDLSFIKSENLSGDASKELARINEGIRMLDSRKASLSRQIKDMRTRWSQYLQEKEAMLSKESEKVDAPLRFGATDDAFVINGWVPARKLDAITRELDSITEGRIFIKAEKPDHHDDVPIKLRNPFFIKPFEWFMDLYTLPKYEEVDPTFLMFLTFPLFFGFMLGDIGYGLVVLPLFLYLRKKVDKDFKRLVDAMIFAAVSSIFFGFLFGEFFGLESVFGYELFHVISRSHQQQELMIVAIAIGAAHINIGLLVGFYNELRSHGFIKAVLEKISWIVLEAAVAMIALSYMGYITTPTYYGYMTLGVAVVMIYLGEGAKGLVELPSIFSQTMSYARLMAVGLASVILAEVINDLAGEMFHAGIVGIIGGILVLIVGHVINIGLGILSPFLHSLRLHYVEFFTKFYHGGGMRYLPFGTEKEADQ